MKNTTINESASPSTERRGRNVIWTMEADAPLRMSPEQHEVRKQVVIFEELEPVPPRHEEKSARQLFLILCLLLTSALAYAVFSGLVKF